MKAQILIAAIVAAVLAVAAGYGQAQSGSEVDVQEKLGKTVALDVPLTDENGNEIALRSLVDKPTILIFNYFRCPGICPILFSSMVNAVNRMDLEPGEDYRLVAVSFDPADTPEMARQKKANYLNMMRRPFPPDAWRFLTGSAADTRAVADSAGFRFRRQSEDMFMHPGVIMVLTPDGILSRYIYGTSYLPAEVMMAIQEARAGQVRPTISKVLSFCYSYDPEGRRYVFRVTRFFGALILALAVLFTVFILFRKKTKQAQP